MKTESHVVVMLVLVTLLAGVAPAAKRGTGGGIGSFGPTMMLADFADLNAAFGRAGITQRIGGTQWGFGGAGYAFMDRVVIGGAGWGGSQTIASDRLSARLNLSGGEFDVGYSVLQLKHLIVTPMLGIGGTGNSIELHEVLPGVPSLDSLLVNPGRTSTVNFGSFLLNPQLMVTVPISFVGLQLKGGYIFTPAAPDWELAGGGRLTGPALPKGAPFIGLNVCFGGIGTGRNVVRVKQTRPDDDEDDD
jgi:hypothetical protein